MPEFVDTSLPLTMNHRHVTPDCDMDHANNESFEHHWIDSQAQVRLLRILAPGSDSSDDIKCSLQVVDVADLPTFNYVALSYFWGEARTRNDVHEITVDNQRYWVRTNLWTFFRSVRNLEHSLPIYVDAICLNQLDQEERGYQVKLMSEVYRHANQVHVWLGSPHAEQDGNLRSLRHDLTANVLHSQWNPRSFIGLSYICSRDYWRRLWIVQELLLSEAAEIHCGPFTFSWNEISQLTRLPLLAGNLERPEEITWWNAWVFTRPRDFSQQRIHDERILDGWQFALRLFHYRNEWLSRGSKSVTQSSGLPIHQAVTAFQFQQCRERRDKIYALIGLLDAEGRSVIKPSYGGSLQQVFIDTAAACLISRWREGKAPTSETRLTHDDRVLCERLNTVLGLTNEGLGVRVQDALQIAASYTLSMRDLPETPNAQSDQPEQSDALQTVPNHSTAFAKSPLRQPSYHSAGTTFEYIFRDFIDHLNVADKADFAEATPKSLNNAIAVIQNRQRAKNEMKNMTRIRGFMEKVTTYQESLDTVLGVPNVAAFVWGSMKFLLEVTSQWGDSFDGLLNQYQRIGESLPAFVLVRSLPGDPSHQSEIITSIFRNIFDFHKLALQYFKKTAWRQLFSATWHFLKAKLERIINEMNDVKSLVETQANAMELEQAQQARTDNATHFAKLLQQTKQARVHSEEGFENLYREETIRQRQHVLKWLSAADAMSDQDRHRGCRDKAGSGKWLLDNGRFQAWLDPKSDSAPLLWVTGIPGAAFFFCRHDDPEKHTFVGMARSILHQLLLVQDSILQYLFKAATTKGETKLRTTKLAKELLTTCLRSAGRVYAIIDGIDDCEQTEQKHVANFWTSYVEQSSSDPEPSKCALLSRDDTLTNQMFIGLPTIRVQGKDHEADIRSYSMARTAEFQRKFRLTDTEKVDIATNAASRAGNMFLFARLVMDILSYQVDKAGIRSEMAPEAFPAVIEDVYNRIIERILINAPAPYRAKAEILLSWVACAARPLKWREIQTAVSVDSERQIVDFDSYQLAVDAKELCGALLEELPNGDISFVHATVKPFLLRAGHVRENAAQINLTDLCLRYLSLPAFSLTGPDNQVREHARTGTYAFLEYALASWTVHIEHTLATCDSAVSLPASLTQILQTLFQMHWKPARKQTRPTTRVRELMDRIAHLDIEMSAKIRDSLSSMHCLMTTNLPDLEAVYTVDLFSFLPRVRAIIEALAAQPDVAFAMQQFYGNHLYKCPRIYCRSFYEGFASMAQRDSHVERHDRSHLCAIAGCPYATIGYPKAEELARHVKAAHLTGPSEDDFSALTDIANPVIVHAPVEPSASATYGRRRRPQDDTSRVHRCTFCPKQFARNYTLRLHMRTHTKERPFACSHCSKSYSRNEDRVRHERRHEQFHSRN